MTALAPASTHNRRVLLTLAALTVAPILLATFAYYYLKPSTVHSYGQLLETRAVPEFAMTTVDGKSAKLAALRGKWLLLAIDPARCDGDCPAALHTIRQIRLAQGEDMNRLRRLWVVSDGATPNAAAVGAAEGAQIRLAKAPVPLPGDLAGGIYLIDPLGNQVMRYARNADHEKVIREISTILKNNTSIG